MFSDDFDRAKSLRNKSERGLDFVEARAIWLDPAVRLVEARLTGDERRFATIGLIADKLWVAIWADVAPKISAIESIHEPIIRIISVHRAEKTKFERMYYDQT